VTRSMLTFAGVALFKGKIYFFFPYIYLGVVISLLALVCPPFPTGSAVAVLIAGFGLCCGFLSAAAYAAMICCFIRSLLERLW